jgi:hypothetical protein
MTMKAIRILGVALLVGTVGPTTTLGGRQPRAVVAGSGSVAASAVDWRGLEARAVPGGSRRRSSTWAKKERTLRRCYYGADGKVQKVR